jgi:predicted GIY-YIG superfamily endonuclease
MQSQFNVCYLLHFDRPLGNPHNPRAMAQHYLGHADRLDRRALEHLTGRGAKITQALVARGIGFQIVRTWPGSCSFERKLKNRKNARKLCPVCQRQPPAGQLLLDLPEWDEGLI